MIPDELVNYLKKERSLDIDFETIKKALTENNWDEEQINEAHLWYEKHDIDDIQEVEQKPEKLPDLQGVTNPITTSETNVNKLAPTVPENTKTTKRKKPEKLTNEETKKKIEIPPNKVTPNHERHIFTMVFKLFSIMTFILILFIISFSLLITYDIISAPDNKLTNEIENTILSISFMPKTSDYILKNIPSELINKPLKTDITITTINSDQTVYLNFNVYGKIMLNIDKNQSTIADLIIKQKGLEIKQIKYLDNKLYTKSKKHNYLISKFLDNKIKFPTKLKLNSWVNNGKYKIPYTKITKEIYNITKDSNYYNKNTHTIRIRLENDELVKLIKSLEEISYEQLTKGLESAVITITLTENNKNIDEIDIDILTESKEKYLINIKTEEIKPFSVKNPTINK